MNFLTVNTEAEYTLTVNRSEFICRLVHVESAEAAQAYLQKICKANSDATHNCYAYILAPLSEKKCADDGEPQGTAGAPILAALERANLYQTLAVVTRYFGGVKLGASGLTAAYGKTVTECIKLAEIVQKVRCAVVELILDYAEFKAFNAINCKFKVVSTDYCEQIKLTVAVDIADQQRLADEVAALTRGRQALNQIEEKYIIF